MGDQFAWLGLLKWTLNHTDGTSDSPAAKMTAEDQKFLETVMRDGVVNEGDRMRNILLQLVGSLIRYMEASEDGASVAAVDLDGMEAALAGLSVKLGNKGEPLENPPPVTTEGLLDLLDELRDIVDQIDFAHSFINMDGLPFLLGCATTPQVPVRVRESCLVLIGTLAQNNPPVQEAAVKAAVVPSLSSMYLKEAASNEASTSPSDDGNGKFLSKILGAASSCIRSHAGMEAEFCASPAGLQILSHALKNTKAATLPRKALFLAKALLTNADNSAERRLADLNRFAPLIPLSLYYTTSADLDSRELAVSFFFSIFDSEFEIQEVAFPFAEQLKENARERISAIQGEELAEGGEREGEIEMEGWIGILKGIQKALEKQKERKENNV